MQVEATGICRPTSQTKRRFTEKGLFKYILFFCCLVSKSCPTLCDPMDYSLPGSSVHRILQARILEWVAMPSSKGSSWLRDGTPALAGRFFTAEPPGKPISIHAAKLLQSCRTLCDPIDGSPPGSAVPGFLQARTLEWVAISFSNAWK